MLDLFEWNKLSKEDKEYEVRKYYKYAELDINGRNIILENMHILDKFLELAIKAKRERKHCGARFLIELVRFNTPLKDKERMFKINNNLSKYMSRIAMAILPELEGFFEIRNHK